MDRTTPAQIGGIFWQVTSWIIFTSLLILSCSSPEPVEEINQDELVLTPVTVQVNDPNDIRLLTHPEVPALLYSNIRGLDSLPLQERKHRFVSALLPAILVAKHEIKSRRLRLELLLRASSSDEEDSLFFEELAHTYRTRDTTALLSAMNTHPNSIVLAQAAVESGWGNSRIFGEANNLFGIWSYLANEPRIPASIKRGDRTIYLRKYGDISESVSDYFVTLGRSKPYRSFRKTRMTTDSVELLLPHLLYYSERREDYVRQLGTMIRFNDLKRYDDYRLDSSYFVVPKSAGE